jgi:hippurate hydrolase
VPGCYLLLGNRDASHERPVHNAGYDFNDAALALGASFFASVVEQRLTPRT